jgi:hypothetical protein
MMKSPFCGLHPVLPLFCRTVMMSFLFFPLCFLVYPLLSVNLFPLTLPRRLVAVVDALLGMLKIVFFLVPFSSWPM